MAALHLTSENPPRGRRADVSVQQCKFDVPQGAKLADIAQRRDDAFQHGTISRREAARRGRAEGRSARPFPVAERNDEMLDEVTPLKYVDMRPGRTFLA